MSFSSLGKGETAVKLQLPHFRLAEGDSDDWDDEDDWDDDEEWDDEEDSE